MASRINDYINSLPDSRVKLALQDAINLTSLPKDVTVAAAGTTAATAAALSQRHAITAVTGADGTKGVMLRQARAIVVARPTRSPCYSML